MTDQIVTKHNRGKRSVTKIVGQLTAGLATTALDLVVITAALGGGMIILGPGAYDRYPKKKRQIKAAINFSDKIISKYQVSKFRQALHRASGLGLLELIERGVYQLTDEGQKKFQDLLPSYKRHLKWDGKLWLITYDISEDNKKARNILRDQLEKIGCGIVQKSVWLSVKDPSVWIEDIIQEYKIQSGVIISSLGKNSSVGSESISKLVQRIFKISTLQKRYQGWLTDVNNNQNEIQQHALEFLSILEIDPVLPLELLPSPWVGEQARQIFETNILPEFGDIAPYIIGL